MQETLPLALLALNLKAVTASCLEAMSYELHISCRKRFPLPIPGPGSKLGCLVGMARWSYNDVSHCWDPAFRWALFRAKRASTTMCLTAGTQHSGEYYLGQNEHHLGQQRIVCVSLQETDAAYDKESCLVGVVCWLGVFGARFFEIEKERWVIAS